MSSGRRTSTGSVAPPAGEVNGVAVAAVIVGAVIGSIVRWTLDSWIDDDSAIGPALLVANTIGAFILGVTFGLGDDDGRRRLAVGVGLCGGLTSFSAWSVMIAEAFEGGHTADGTALILAHLVAGFSAFIAARAVTRRARRILVGEVGHLG
ncbi:MAG: CrcB family protein [Actinomycetota bacterium]